MAAVAMGPRHCATPRASVRFCGIGYARQCPIVSAYGTIHTVIMWHFTKKNWLIAVLLMGSLFVIAAKPHHTAAATSNGSVGVQGTISAPPPSEGATITIPRDGQVFDAVPITVSGLCKGDVLVKIFKNNVFAGSVQCKNNSFSLQIDLFIGQNELIAKVYDALDQAGPDSNKVTVTFNDNKNGTGSRILLTSNYAKRGANPGEVLTWPIIVSGGVGPYAISVDWGDGSAPQLISQPFAGTFTIQHTYASPGIYNLVVKGTDVNGGVSYLQLVAVANGALGQDTGTAGQNKNNPTATTTTKTTILWQPAAVLVPFIVSTFWLGKRYELRMIRRRIEQGDRPF